MTNPEITFDTPRDVISFIRQALKNADMDRLYDAAIEPTSGFWREPIFEDLREIDASETLEAVFITNARFPKHKTEYKLGGHSTRTRHLHIDLIRVGNTWRLKSIWKCR